MDNQQQLGNTQQNNRSELKVAFVESIDTINPQVWDGLMTDNNPFNKHAYLAALEQSGCVSQQTGWLPQHLVVSHSNEIVAVMPLYIKTHSYGEYIFDWAWAEAYERHQIPYYPKLVSAIPFTPVTGLRIGVASSIASQGIWDVLTQALNERLVDDGFSSWHCLFLPKAQLQSMSHASASNDTCLNRLSTQFHWHNRDYQSFDGFLMSLTSRKRKDVKKQRAKLKPLGLQYEFVSGVDITKPMWRHFYACYRQTYAKRSGHAGYLNQAFFESLSNKMADNVLLLLVRNADDELLAAALYFKSDTHLYGRYWGCLVDIDGLHFEACYYQGIEYCIAQQLQVFDAGAQGEHKVARGFEPVETFSTHEIAHPQFRSAIASFTFQEADNIKLYMTQLADKLPYRQVKDESE